MLVKALRWSSSQWVIVHTQIVNRFNHILNYFSLLQKFLCQCFDLANWIIGRRTSATKSMEVLGQWHCWLASSFPLLIFDDVNIDTHVKFIWLIVITTYEEFHWSQKKISSSRAKGTVTVFTLETFRCLLQSRIPRAPHWLAFMTG